MMKIHLFFLVLCTSLYANLAEIGFSSNWILDDGAVITNDTLTITGDKSKYIKARITVPVDETTESVYFMADVWLTEIDGGPESHKSAKFKILNGATGKSIEAFNMSDLIQQEWYSTGMHLSRFHKKGISSLTLEFSLQNAAGTMSVATPQLLSSTPEPNYRFPFDLSSDNSCSIELNSDEVRKFPDHLLSINSHFVWANGNWSDLGVRDIIKNRMPLGNLRFPAGTVGNFYDWQSDGFFGDEWTFLSASRKSAYERGFRFGFDDYLSLCKESGATSTLMFNVIHDSPQTAANRLRDRLNKGAVIDWIELGNENFFTEQSFGNVNSIDSYISHTSAVTSALKSVDPSIKTAVNLNHHDWGAGSWNHRLSQENYFDAAVIHPYVQTNTFLLNNYSANVMLSSYKTTQERLKEYEVHFPGKPLLCTEWSVLSAGAPSNFIQLLGIADLFMALLEGNDRGVVQQLGIHMLYHSDNYNEATCYFKENGSLKRTRIGVFYEKVVSLLTGSTIFDGVGKSGELDRGIPGVIARAVTKNDSLKILVVNKLPTTSPLNITLDGKAFSGNHEIEWFSEEIIGDSSGYDLDENPWRVTQGSGVPSIPPYSIAVVTVNPGETAVQGIGNLGQSGFSLSHTGGELQLNSRIPGAVDILTLSGRVVESHNQFIGGIIGKDLTWGVYLLRWSGGGNSIVQKIVIP